MSVFIHIVDKISYKRKVLLKEIYIQPIEKKKRKVKIAFSVRKIT